MRSIDIETDLFALIWANRLPGEDSENGILARILKEYIKLRDSPAESSSSESFHHLLAQDSPHTKNTPRVQKEVDSSKLTRGDSIEHRGSAIGKIRWVDDVQEALRDLGGSASLHEIYKEVECRRRNGNRSVPKTLDAVVRRTLEEHSTDSKNFERNLSSPDLFANVGRGEWALRKRSELSTQATPTLKDVVLPFNEANDNTQKRNMQMNIDCDLKPLPTEGEVMAELEDYLIKLGRPARPTEVYNELGLRFGLTNEQRSRLMPNGKDIHWENRVRFARRKLKDSGKLDPDQPRGWWATRPARSELSY